MRRRQRSAWFAVLLVLLHVLAPNLHSLQHAHSLPPIGGGRCAWTTATHDRGAAHTPRESAHALQPDDGDSEECSLCALLASGHGFVPFSALPLPQPTPLQIASIAVPYAPPSAPTVISPPARGPPHLLDS